MTTQKDDIKVFETVEEQALHRPGMWIGSTKSTIKELSIWKDGGFENDEVDVIPAVAKLVEEIIVNSADEHIRTLNPKVKGWTLNKIDVELNESGLLTVKDNGGISSQLHSSGQHNVEVIFGKLFSSSNYDDTVTREVVGTNGVGSSLTNLFSKEFHVSSSDGVNKVETSWYENKSRQSDVKVTPCKEHGTFITAQLDIERFNIDEIPYGIMKYIEKLCIIIAASNPALEVSFNGENFKFNSFREYVNLYGYDDKVVIGEINKDWEVYIVPSYDKPQRFGIVNGAECNEGTHVKHLDGIIIRRIQAVLKKLKMDNLITTHMIKQEFSTFIRMKVDKPEYTSQAKTELTNSMQKVKDDEKYWITISKELTSKIKESFIVDSLKDLFAEKNDALKNKEIQRKAKELKKTSTKSIRKLLDANEKSLSKRQKECQLWIFEGDSAGKGFRPARDPKTQGCYFLRGKCKNSIGMSTIKVLNNEAFANIIVALGLDPRNPHDLSKLRYKQIILSTDADVDGHSIIGQLLTLFGIHFPELLRKGHIYRSVSPLWRAVKGKDTQYFYDNDAYEMFTSKNKGYKGKYFKGLGSLEKKDYAMMISHPHFEKFSISDECIGTLHAFMGSDSQKRKRILEAEV